MTTQNKRFIGILLTASILLLIPLAATLFTGEMKWSAFDFIVAGIVLLGFALIGEFVLRRVKKTQHRIIACGAVFGALLLVWVELSVGIFGTPFAGN